MLSKKHITAYAAFYFTCFLVNYAWSFYHGLTFSQLQPVFFLNKPDLTGNVILLTGLQHQLISSQAVRILFDLVYLSLPLLLVYTCIKDSRLRPFIAISNVIFNIVYNYYFSMMSFISIEVTVGWMLVPLIFTAKTSKGYYYLIRCMRILFILFFFSAALWKIRAGGIFNIEQMSAILLWQHAAYIADMHNWFSGLVMYLIDHQKISYSLYLLAFLAELIFVIGFFTRKYDRALILIFMLFACFNYFLMEINYFTWLPFMGCLYLSRYKPGDSINS